MYKEVESHITILQLDGFTLRAEGVLEQPYDWSITMSYQSDLLSPRVWKRREYCWDAKEVDEMVWEEAMSLIEKYAVKAHETGIVEIEVDDEEEE